MSAAVTIDIHHNPGDIDGRVWMVVFNKGHVHRLTTDELQELSAKTLLALGDAHTAAPVPDAIAAELTGIIDRIHAEQQARVKLAIHGRNDANDAQPIDAGHPDLWSLSASEPF